MHVGAPKISAGDALSLEERKENTIDRSPYRRKGKKGLDKIAGKAGDPAEVPLVFSGGKGGKKSSGISRGREEKNFSYSGKTAVLQRQSTRDPSLKGKKRRQPSQPNGERGKKKKSPSILIIKTNARSETETLLSRERRREISRPWEGPGKRGESSKPSL